MGKRKNEEKKNKEGKSVKKEKQQNKKGRICDFSNL